MNIAYTLSDVMTAKTCGCRDRRQVAYAFSVEPHSLCLDKKDVLEAQIDACERLLKYTNDASEKSAVEKEISELRMALDLIT